MSRDLQLDIAVTHLICPVCGGETDSHIVMDSRLKQPHEGTPLHDKVHGKATGISKNMCDNCRQRLTESDPTGIYLVEFDPEQTSEESMKDGNVWRTGNVVAVTRAAFQRWFNAEPPAGQWGYTEFPIVKNIMDQSKNQE